MRKTLIVLFILFLSAQAAGAQGIVFETGTIAEAMEKAKAENKPVFVDVYTDWCGPCKVMSFGAFREKKVGDLFNQSFINIKVDAEDGGEGEEFAKNHQVSGYPTLLWLNPDGKVLHRVLGAKKADQLIDEAGLMSETAQYGGLEAMAKRYQDGENDLEFLLVFFNAIPQRDKMGRSEVAIRYLRNIPDETLYNVDDTETILMLGQMMDAMETFDLPVANRMFEGNLDLFASGQITPDYHTGVIWPFYDAVGRVMDKAIERGDRKAMEILNTFKEKFSKNSTMGHTYDDIVNNNVLRPNIFYLDTDHRWLRFMVANEEPGETFVPYLEEFMEKNMAQISVEQLDDKYNKKIDPYYEVAPSMLDAAIGNFKNEGGLGIEDVISFSTYYWYLTPSDQKTKDTIASWINWILRVNPLYTKGVINSVPLMLKIGKKDDVMANIKFVMENCAAVAQYYPGDHMEELQKMLDRVENDKAF